MEVRRYRFLTSFVGGGIGSLEGPDRLNTSGTSHGTTWNRKVSGGRETKRKIQEK